MGSTIFCKCFKIIKHDFLFACFYVHDYDHYLSPFYPGGGEDDYSHFLDAVALKHTCVG